MDDFFKKMFIDEVKPALNRHSGSDESGGGSSGVIEVDELPTENIDENAIYKVNKVTDINVYVKTGTNAPSTLFEAVESLGVTPTITYYLIDDLPENPNVSDLITFSSLHIYIYDDMALGFGNVGGENRWLGVSALISSVTGITHDNKGYCSSPSEMGEQGVYVTYKISTIGVSSSNSSLKTYDGGWNDYKSIFDKSIISFSSTEIKRIYSSQFYACTRLKNINLPNVEAVYDKAFYACLKLETISLPNVTAIHINAFDQCHSLKSVILSNRLTRIYDGAFAQCSSLKDVYYMGTEEEWNAITIADGNEALTSATIHYNYVPE